MTDRLSEAERCKATIWKRDTYRYTGRGKSGFEMHYNERRCSRSAVTNGYCKQHAELFGRRALSDKDGK